ncbi:hypothetical protein [Phocaeicola plebeius]|uniref:hypothetical protein n=1 Tax=Phocaeicola plebeius TaxID=310297 RepID=UPI0026EA4751|nr:hypothetical protein [Phocaeicola plebeius]
MALDYDVSKLYEVMRMLDSSVQRIGEFWNDRVATAISVNMVNELIGSCNKANSELTSLSVEVSGKLSELECLSNEPD